MISLQKFFICSLHVVSQLSGSIAVCPRGTCEFSVKAEVAESGGAAILLLINDDPGCIFGLLYALFPSSILVAPF